MSQEPTLTILLSLNETGKLQQLIEAARSLGAQFNAHVTGLFVIPAVQVYPMVGYDAVPETYDGNRQFFLGQADHVRQSFEKAMAADGLSFAYQQVDGRTPQIAMEVASRARAHDMVIVATPQPDGGSGIETDFAERVVMLAGRPVLVLPRDGIDSLSLRDIIIGWDGGREAARAVFDALPLLRSAARVRLIGIDVPPRGVEPEADIARALAHHGVKTEVVHVASDGMSAGDTLLRAAKDHGAGLIVMGAYGHSRFSEVIFGGATRHMFRNLNLPVLFSH